MNVTIGNHHRIVKQDFPEANCFLYCLIMKETISFKSEILYNHEHCILKIWNPYGGYFIIDRNGEFKNDITKYTQLNDYGYGPTKRLFESALI